MALQTIWPKIKLNKPWLNSNLLYIFYFSLYVLYSRHTVLSSQVCRTERQNNSCHCVHEDENRAVKCLKGDFNDSCREYHARKSYQLFCEVMSQINCKTHYSVKWNCTHCWDAYTKWLVAVFRPVNNDAWLSNCIGEEKNVILLCKDVLARCPYFAPQDSYGDTAAFVCPINEEDYNQTWICD